MAHQVQDIVVTYCCPNPGSSDSADENPLSKGKHRQVSLMEIEKDLIGTEKVMWDVNESYNRKREKTIQNL